MEKSRKIIDIVFKTISKLSDEEIESIINKEGKLVYVNEVKKTTVMKNNDKDVSDVCCKLDKIYSRQEAYKLLKKNTLKKDDIISIANHYEIRVLKSYTKSKIIDNIVESIVGIKEDKEAIKNVSIK